MAEPRRKVASVTIANGAALSGAVFIGGSITRIEMPAGWTAAALTFQVSSDGVNFINLFDEFNSEVIIGATAAVANRAIRLKLAEWTNVLYLILRSGTSATPVNQGAERIIRIVHNTYD